MKTTALPSLIRAALAAPLLLTLGACTGLQTLDVCPGLRSLGFCSAFYKREPVVYRENLAVYRIDADDYPAGSLAVDLPSTEAFPEMDADRLVSVLGNLEYQRDEAWGETRGRVFSESQLRKIAPTVLEALARSGAGYRVILVTRYDQDRSVLSRMERNTAMLWSDEEGLNVVFGEIREELPQNDFLIEADWTDVLPINLRRAYPDLQLLESDYFRLKKIQGLTHRTWAVIHEEDLQRVEYTPPENETKAPAGDTKTPAPNSDEKDSGDKTSLEKTPVEKKSESDVYFVEKAREDETTSKPASAP